MNLLAIDTARGVGSVAVLVAGRVESLSLGAGPGFGEVLFGAIERLLASVPLPLDAMDGFAAATGPGSFTGIRVGLGAAKALAEASGKPLLGVSSLRALARAAGDPGPVAALLDARRGDLFAGCYGEAREPRVPEMMGRWEELAPALRGFDRVLAANEPGIFGPGGPAAGTPLGARRLIRSCLARSVALLASVDLAVAERRDPAEVEANYIRRASAVPPRAYAARR